MFWNEYPIELAIEEVGKQSKDKKSATLKTSKRKRRAISPPIQTEQPSSSKRKRSKRKLVFDQSGDVPLGSNPLNLPYSDSEPETEQLKAQETEQQIEEEQSQDVPSSAEPIVEPSGPSTSKNHKVNKLLHELFHARHTEKQTKIHNVQLIERNMELYDHSKEIMKKHMETVERNSLLMKENASLYRKIKILKLKMKESAVQVEKPSGLEALAEIATTFEDEIPIKTHQENVRRSTRLKGSSSKRS